jgi:integrase
MALYKANTGCRQEEVCSLRWEWEKQMPEFGRSVFVVPGEKVKNTEERLVVLNRIARSVIEEARGMHPVYVFVRRSDDGLTVPVKVAPEGFRRVRVHDLNTFGRRLRAAGVSFEDRQDLLGHKSQRITTHYSHPELSNRIAAAEKACG